MNYSTYIQSIEWTARRAAFLVKRKCREEDCPFEGEHWICQGCGTTLSLQQLEVHHKTYDRLGQEQDSDLEVLCGECHKAADKDRKARGKQRRQRNSLFSKRAAGWGQKVYGSHWRKNVGVERVTREFEAWLEAKGIT